MIPYIEVLKWNAGKTALNTFQVIEPSECWFELSYYEVGQFEVYAPASAKTLSALQKGNFVMIPHKDYIWVILSVQYEFNVDGARMISAKGYEAKQIVGKRIIRDPLQLPTNLSNALETMFSANLGTNAIAQRRIAGLTWAWNGLSGKTTDAQATRGNLLDFTLNLLKLHKVGTKSTLSNGKVLFATVNGSDRSNSVIFSQSLDNLIKSTFFTSDENLKTNCQIVSTFNEQENVGGVSRSASHDYVAYYPDETAGGSGIDRDEMTISPNLSTKVINNGVETEIAPDSATFINMQKAEGAAALADHITVTELNGEIDLANSQYEFDVDFSVGDIVKIRDEYFGIQANARIVKYTIKQDAGGYGEIADYE